MNTSPTPTEITPPELYARRREFLKTSIGVGLVSAVAPGLTFAAPAKLGDGAKKSALSTSETQTPLKHITSYNNFYEFGTDKEDPAQHAPALQNPAVDGERSKDW